MASVSSVFLLSSMFLICFFSTFSLSAANLLGNETDKFALLAFKAHITSDPHEILSSWNESNNFCNWEGVLCGHRHRRVTNLTLASKDLVGSISPHIGNLSFLRVLVLMNNSLQGEIPSEIGKLFRLEYLSLQNNSLGGKIPVNISFCFSIKDLRLRTNNLVGNIPIELGFLPKLTVLDFHSNQLTGGIPPSFGNLTSLQKLHLGPNKLDGKIPSSLGQLKKLTFLSLGGNNLHGTVPPPLYNLSNLEVFALNQNRLTGNLPIQVGLALPNLKRFLIAGNMFSGPIQNSLFNVSKLDTIDLSQNQFTGKVPLAVGNLKNLLVLNLEINSLGSGKPGDLEFVTSLTNCSNLNVLAASYNHLGGALPTSVGNLSTQLSQLYLGVNRISGNIPSEIQNLQKLTSINLATNLLTGSIPKSFSNMQNLQMIGLESNQLSGHIPSTRNMSSLYILDLPDNLFEGTISPALENQILEELIFAYNRFSGTIPKEIGQSSRLQIVDLRLNLLSGSIPTEVGDLKNLIGFAITDNNMSGEIPNTLVSCSSLQKLYLDGNSFHGPLPSSMDSLVDLRFLDVSNNKLSGNIPKELSKLSDLVYLNLSFNGFEGEVPKQGIFLNSSAFSISGNPNVCGGISDFDLPKCHSQLSKKQGARLSLKVSLCVFLPLFVVVIVIVTYLMRKSKSKVPSNQSGLDASRVSFIELHKATNEFSAANLIGLGRYGSVYKGMNRQGEPIAVKVLNLMERGAAKTFLAECEALRVIRHRNLLKIFTVCSSVDFHGNDFKALVFEFMHNGSLESWLHPAGSEREQEPRYLTFHQRLTIAIDIVTALDYLHNDCEDPVIHCDLKSGNVLLGDDLTAHVGDFGLAKFLSTASTSTASDTSSISVRGTIGYIPPEYGTGAKVSTQGDVFSFGILLLEMFTGKRPTDPIFKDGLTLHEYTQLALPDRVMEIVDISLLSECHDDATTTALKESFISILRIGVGCSMNLTMERKSIDTALKELNSIKRNIA